MITILNIINYRTLATNEIHEAHTKLAHWYKDVELTGFKAFHTIVNTISVNYRSILNYFINRSTYASADREAATK